MHAILPRKAASYGGHLTVHLLVFTARWYAERGIATASRLLVRKSGFRRTKALISFNCGKTALRLLLTRSQVVARIADRTAKNCRGHVT